MHNDLEKKFGHRAIRNIALPMIVSTVSVPLLGIVDTAVLGHLDRAVYLAAVAVGATVFSVLFMTLNFLRMGTTGIAAQAFGAADPTGMLRALLQPAAIALVLAAVLLATQKQTLAIALALLNPEREVIPFVREYFALRIWGAPAMLLNLVFAGWMLGMQNARATLAVFLTVNVTNMLLDVLLVWGLGMEVRGVAAATVVAEYTGWVLALVLVRKMLRRHGVVWQPRVLTQPGHYRRLLRVNGALFLRSVALMFVFAFLTAQGARLGTRVLAVNAVLLNFLYFFSYATDGLANAAEALVGKAVGEHNRAGLELAVRNTQHWTIGFIGLFSAFYLFAGPLIVDLLTGLDELRIAARDFLPWLVLLPAASGWCFLYDGVYIGMTRSREMMLVMIGSVLLVFLPVWYALGHAAGAGNHALWGALISFMALRSLAMHLWYRRILHQGG